MFNMSGRTHTKIFGLALFILILFVTPGNTEIFTALVDMEDLLETEAVLISNLEGYINVQETKLNHLKMKAVEYQKEHLEAKIDITAYISNPINAYLLTKRLTSDWKRMENLMTQDVGLEFLKNISNYRRVLKFPSDEDLNGAAVALIRLQDTYNLDTASLAKGQLNGIQYSTEMSSNDCFELGRQSYINGDYDHTAMWMREAMERLTTEGNNAVSVSKVDILEYLAFATYKQGNIQNAMVMTNELLKLDPNHERAKGNKDFYETALQKRLNENKLKGENGSMTVKFYDLNVSKSAAAENERAIKRRKYEMLCRGDVLRSPSVLRSLRCRYEVNTSYFLKIAPIKYEEINLDPHLVQFYDVISDKEIELVKKLARPRFQRATVQNSATGELETASYRISKSAWLKDSEHTFIDSLTRRTEDMTGLSMETVEELQVVNYGIGGHYDTHFDFARKEETNAFRGMSWGNRVATILFYMSDVEQGGATVFPDLDVAVWPKKGTAAFWYNLHRTGDGDYRTSHAACPVLTGSKWVSNKWVHEHGQMFRRKCALQPDGPFER